MPIIPLSKEEKELYAKLDFHFFLVTNFYEPLNTAQQNKDLVTKGYAETLVQINKGKKSNRYQYHLFLEGYIRKMHDGGLLPLHFNLSGQNNPTILNYEEYGRNWAYFDAWAKRERWINWKAKASKRIIEIGALIGYVLGAIQLYNFIAQY